jgi:hypothetical protein
MNPVSPIYIPMGQDGFELCHPVDETEFETLNGKISGEPQGGTWRPIKVRLIRTDNGKKLKESDSPWLGSNVLIFRDSVVQKMGSLLEKYGELLPLAESGSNLFVYNPWICMDALDLEKSEIKRLSSGKILRIVNHVFHVNAIGHRLVFKISNMRVSPIFVCQSFVDEWSAAELHGLEFLKVSK